MRHLFFILTVISRFFIVDMVHAEPSDDEIAYRLAKGEAALAVWYKPYVTRKDYKIDPARKFESLEQLIAEAMEPAGHFNGNLMIINPANPNEEIRLEAKSTNGIFVYVGPPGEYIISRFTEATMSLRLYGKAILESGKIKYLGNFYRLSQRPKFLKFTGYPQFDFRYKPEEFGGWFSTNYQRSYPVLVNEPLQLKEEQ